MTSSRPWVRDLTVLDNPHDVVVVGGGAVGLHIALELAGRGVRVLVLERDDIGSGTSSPIPSPVHGAAPYLERGDIRSALDAVRERRRLVLSTPHLMLPRRSLIPVWDWSHPGRFPVGARLGAYAGLLTGVRPGSSRASRADRGRGRIRISWLSAASALATAPWLRAGGLAGAFTCDDLVSVHPQRLLLSVARSAVDLDADVLTHTRVTRILTEPGPMGDTVYGVEVTDELTGAVCSTRADLVINAAGPWAAEALGDLGTRLGLAPRLEQHKTVQLATRALGGSASVLARTHSGACVGVSSWHGLSVIGPTRTTVGGHPGDTSITPDDIDLIGSSIDEISGSRLEAADLRGFATSAHVTYRARAAAPDGDPRRLHLLRHDGSHVLGLMTVVGGAETTARSAGEVVAETVVRTTRFGRTRKLDSRRPPPHGAVDDPDRVELVRAAATDGTLERGTADHLVRLYGSAAAEVVDLVRRTPRLGRRLSDDPGRQDIAAQVVYAVTHESARTLVDVVDRRLTLGALGLASAGELTAAAGVMAPLLGWDSARTAHEVQRAAARRAEFRGAVRQWEALKRDKPTAAQSRPR